MVENTTKICSACGEDLPLRYFSFRTDTGKLRDQCKKCHKGYLSDLFVRREEEDALFSNGKKKCSRCLEVKDLDCFGKDVNTRLKLTSRCRQCLSEINKHPKKKKENRKRRAKLLYGVSDSEADRIEKAKTCEICGIDVSGKDKHIDHDHNNGYFRGVLCKRCNLGLGFFNDRIDLLIKASEYLKDKTR